MTTSLRPRASLWAVAAWAAVFVVAAGAAGPGKYLGPCAVVASRDGGVLYVANADAAEVAVIDVARGAVTRRIHLPAEPTGLALSPDGRRLYVTCAAPRSRVVVIETATGKAVAAIPAGHTAAAPAVSPDGKRLYVCNRFDNGVSVIDLEARREVVRVAAAREPIAAALTPDGRQLWVANYLPADPADRHGVDAVSALVTVIDTRTNRPSSVRLTTGSTSVRGICVSPDGRYVYAVHVLARYHLPTIQVLRGWMNGNAMTVIEAATGRVVNTVLLDDPDEGAANPWDVACTADGRSICVSHAGTHELSVIDAAGLLARLRAMPMTGFSSAFLYGEPFYYSPFRLPSGDDVANNLTFLVGLRRRIKLEGKGPRGLAVVGATAYAAEYFSDTLAAANLDRNAPKPVTSLALGPKPVLTPERKGQVHFHDAALCFQRWQSCASCHPEGRMDGLNWDLLNDRAGNPNNTKSLLLAHKTPPAMSLGVRPTAEAAVRSGLEKILFAPPSEEQAAAIDAYLKSLRPVPSPRLANGRLSAAARRGKVLFESERVGCGKCHPPPWYTDLLAHDVGSRGPLDPSAAFDTPTLIELWRTAPYMHDGHYTTIEELLSEGKHGGVEKLDPHELRDLAEFVLSL